MWNIEKIVSKGDYDYALVKDHPYATKNGYVLYHRVVIENHLGRLLNENEVVHHKDGNKKNNSINNLEVVSRSDHSKSHILSKGHRVLKMKCPWCGKIFFLKKNQSFLSKKNKLNCNCCSKSCRGKMSRQIQLYGITAEMKDAISVNILAEYIEYTDEDNTEETFLQEVP